MIASRIQVSRKPAMVSLLFKESGAIKSVYNPGPNPTVEALTIPTMRFLARVFGFSNKPSSQPIYHR